MSSKQHPYRTGRNGEKCTPHDILKATHATNNLKEAGSIGSGILSIKHGMNKSIKWGCSADNIQKQ